MTINVEEDLVPEDGKIKTISALASEMLELEAEITEKIEEVKKLGDIFKKLQEVTIPDAMKSAGISELKLENGVKLFIDEDMAISVPKKNMGLVCGWLRDNNHGDIIKNEVTVPISKGEDERVKKLEEALTKLKFAFTREENVHSGTLKALLKEQRSKGTVIDLKLFGAFEYQKAKIELPKQPKTK